MDKTIALFFASGSDYREKMRFWIHNSVASFKKWHPEIEVRLVTDDILEYPFELFRFKYTKQMFEQGYSRVLIIGVDILTTGYMSEFIDDRTTPILAAYEGKCVHPDVLCDKNTFCHRLRGVLENQWVNTDTILFNSVQAVEKMIEYVVRYSISNQNDMYALNMLNKETDIVKCVPWPYFFSPVTYNSAALGFLAGYKCFRDDGLYFGCDGPKISDILPTRLFLRQGNIMYNHEGKIVKSIHFSGDVKNFKLNLLFSDDIRSFLEKECNVDFTIEQIV